MPFSRHYLDWVRSVKPELKHLDTIPLTGAMPAFPWDQLGERLAGVFEKNEIIIVPGEIQWRSSDELFEGLGSSPKTLAFSVTSLKGMAWWVMPEQVMALLTSQLITRDPQPAAITDDSLAETFYRFLAVETLYQFTQLQFDNQLLPILLRETSHPGDDSLCIDISVSIDQSASFMGRLMISQELRESWVHYFEGRGPTKLSDELAESLTAVIHVEAGSTQLNLKQWQEVQLGDFIILDQSDLSGDNFEGRVVLTVNGHRAFRAKVKDGNIKILEFPLYHDLETPMPSSYEPEEEKLNKRDELEEDDESEFDEDFDTEESFVSEDNDEESFENEKESQYEKDDSIENELPLNDEEDSVEETQAKEPIRRVEPIVPITPDNIPISLIVELGRVELSMKSLLELEPGNLLELDVDPVRGVDLVVNGKVVGKGELIKLGEALGVRVLELGK